MCSIIGRTYTGEVLIQIWLKSMKAIRQTMNVQKENLKIKLPGFKQAPEPTKKCAMNMKEERKELLPHQNIFVKGKTL